MVKLRIIDENIRSEWARITRTTGETLGQACDSTHTYAASLWMTEPTRLLANDRTPTKQKIYDRGGGDRGGGGGDRGDRGRDSGKGRGDRGG
eukprot:4266129-Heterocapsa_arctica.AAC.1